MKEAAVRHADLTVLTLHQAVPSLATGNPENYDEDLSPLERDRTSAEELVKKAASELGEQRPGSVTVRVVND